MGGVRGGGGGGGQGEEHLGSLLVYLDLRRKIQSVVKQLPLKTSRHFIEG